jgi:hypothetical protein
MRAGPFPRSVAHGLSLAPRGSDVSSRLTHPAGLGPAPRLAGRILPGSARFISFALNDRRFILGDLGTASSAGHLGPEREYRCHLLAPSRDALARKSLQGISRIRTRALTLRGADGSQPSHVSKAALRPSPAAKPRTRVPGRGRRAAQGCFDLPRRMGAICLRSVAWPCLPGAPRKWHHYFLSGPLSGHDS